jgi:predicted nuclease with RNAse H fold
MTPAEPAVYPDLTNATKAVGIDVGATTAWLVAVNLATPRPQVTGALLVHPIDCDAIAAFCGDAAVAIDAPGGFSVRAHQDDARLAPKFRTARCGEVALARAGIAVPFVTPAADSPRVAPWMQTGFGIWDRLREQGLNPLETYPHGVYWRLAGRPLVHKQLPSGALHRLLTIAREVDAPPGIEMWCHDGLDALAAALVAWHAVRREAVPISCSSDNAWPTHDGSAIWLPPAQDFGSDSADH